MTINKKRCLMAMLQRNRLREFLFACDMKISFNKRILAVGACLLAAAFVISVTPWYHAYCAEDHRWTCAKIRKTIDWDYAHRLEDGETGSIGLLEQVIAARFESDEYTVIPASSVTPADKESPEGTIVIGLCKDGGTFHITLREGTYVTVTCDAENHDVDYYDLLIEQGVID